MYNLHNSTPSIGNFQDNFYWNSTEEPYGNGGESGDAWCQDFESSGDQSYDGKDNLHIVRAVRTFVIED